MTAYVVDTSVLHRLARSPEIAERVAMLRRSGALWACPVVTMELGYSARNHDEWARIVSVQSRVHQAVLTTTTVSRALAVQGELAARGMHRVSLPDLLIAAAAETAGVTVLHYDSDYDTIASVTGQPVEWVAPRGSIT
jgi:predicted nucleic acid-binding protein